MEKVWEVRGRCPGEMHPQRYPLPRQDVMQLPLACEARVLHPLLWRGLLALPEEAAPGRRTTSLD
jgi:hypothetical protein